MTGALRSSDPELRDLAKNSPRLIEAMSGEPTGVTLLECLAVGGMASVFRAELEPARRSKVLSPLCPRRLAIKLMKPSTLHELELAGLAQEASFEREAMTLRRIMDRHPPTEFVVGFYGCGHTDVAIGANRVRLPWLAIELIDGGLEGSSLSERIDRTRDGCDPVRAARLARGICEGVRALHDEGIVHRDLKPDNVLVVGPLDDETPKIADCGVARVDGLMTTLAALTWEYGGPEQLLSRQGVKNPLVGPWTDVHALAAVIWYILGGEHWCRSRSDRTWRQGERRSLRTARRLHPALAAEGSLLEEIDRVLARGASPRLPAAVAARPGAPPDAEPRFESVDAFATRLLPLLDACAQRSVARAAHHNHAATSFRTTQPVDVEDVDSVQPLAEVIDLDFTGPIGGSLVPATPAGVAFQPDGRALARFGAKLFFLTQGTSGEVRVPPAEAPVVLASQHVTRGPGGGFALIGRAHIRLIREGSFRAMPLPSRDKGEVGAIEAALGDGRVFGVVTAETEDCEGGPELWISRDGSKWSPPAILPLGGRIRSIASGPYGYLVVGASPRGTRARALFLGFDGQTNVYTAGVNDHPPLHAALCGADRIAWGAGVGFVLAFDRATATAEDAEEMPASEPPLSMALDPVGVPWLLTPRTLLRRHARANAARWTTYYRQEPGAPSFVAIGFTSEGAWALDERGRGVQLVPQDIAAWKGVQSLASRR
jgi:serine/threonine protein kinase